jgi:FixJ family two-component response regulator
MAEQPPTIFVIDDDASVLRSLARLLSAAGLNVESFPSAEAYLERQPYAGLGCIVLDICMAGLSGPDLQARLAQSGCSIPILFLTAHGSIPLSVSAVKQGAVDFLTKPVDEEVLLQAIHQSLARHKEILRERADVAALRARLDVLTPREREVLRCVLTGALNKQIASRLGIGEKTVKIHRGRVMEKLGLDSVAGLVRFCAAAGVPPASVTDAGRFAG